MSHQCKWIAALPSLQHWVAGLLCVQNSCCSGESAELNRTELSPSELLSWPQPSQ